MKSYVKPVIAALALVAGGAAMAQISFYEGEGYRGRVFSTQQTVPDFTRFGFNDAASSVVVDRGRFEVCEDVRFQGRCVVLRRGSYDSLRSLGFNNRISSVRPIGANARYAGEMPEPVAVVPDYQYRRRPSERTFEVPVQTVRAVVGPPEQRCWVERQAVTQQAPSNQPNIGGAIVGGLIGGILGHQVGGGSGKDIATAGGAVGGREPPGLRQRAGDLHPRRAEMPERGQHHARLLGRDLQLPRPAAQRADVLGARPDHRGQRQG